MPVLLEMLDLEEQIVTANAMHTQRATAAVVTARGGDYVLALKANRDSLHEDVRLYLDDPAQADERQSRQRVDGDHGRIETRRATACPGLVPGAAMRSHGCSSAMTGPASPPSARARRGAKPQRASKPKPATIS